MVNANYMEYYKYTIQKLCHFFLTTHLSMYVQILMKVYFFE